MASVKYDTVIFDLDGTILDTLEDLKQSINYALKKSGYPERSCDEVRRFVGNGIRKLVERAVPEGVGTAECDKVHEIFTEHYAVHCADNTCEYEGITELVKKLRDAGCKTAVVSNKADYAVKSLCETYFKGLFDVAVGEREGVAKKPSPDSVNACLKELNGKKGVYIGDSDVDIETAKNANLDAIIVDWGFRDREFLREHGAKVIVGTTSEIYEIIKG
jgi:phosphoglycolate phosphatase